MDKQSVDENGDMFEAVIDPGENVVASTSGKDDGYTDDGIGSAVDADNDTSATDAEVYHDFARKVRLQR